MCVYPCSRYEKYTATAAKLTKKIAEHDEDISIWTGDQRPRRDAGHRYVLAGAGGLGGVSSAGLADNKATLYAPTARSSDSSAAAAADVQNSSSSEAAAAAAASAGRGVGLAKPAVPSTHLTLPTIYLV